MPIAVATNAPRLWRSISLFFPCFLLYIDSKAILDPISVVEQCLQLRERRNGVDRCLDEVQSSLHEELRTMRQGEMVLGRTVHEATEQIRLLRSCKYQLDRDLADKSKASEIDSTTAGLADSVVSDSRTPR